MSEQPQRISPPEKDKLCWTTSKAADSIPASKLAARMAAAAFDPLYREAWTESQIASLLLSSNGWLDFGWDGDDLVAFALNRQVLDEIELLLCAVDPAFRRRGYGRALIDHVVEAARARGGAKLFLEVRASNDAALALYVNTGFSGEARRPGYYRTTDGQSIDAITLTLPI